MSASRGRLVVCLTDADDGEGWTSLSLSNIRSSSLLKIVSNERRPSSRELSTSMWPAIESIENDQPMPRWPYEDQRRIHDGCDQAGETGWHGLSSECTRCPHIAIRIQLMDFHRGTILRPWSPDDLFSMMSRFHQTRRSRSEAPRGNVDLRVNSPEILLVIGPYIDDR